MDLAGSVNSLDRDSLSHLDPTEQRHARDDQVRTVAGVGRRRGLALVRPRALASAFDVEIETPATEHPSFLDGRTAEIVIGSERSDVSASDASGGSADDRSESADGSRSSSDGTSDGGETVGVIGEIDPAVLVEHDLEVPVAAFEIRRDALE